ncbi:phospholipid/glycerol acyltransferase [Calothrix sp. NIES-4071]|nr:phospholipid/glycerol acyltransferase [Calothrix sp. NIES-4071]BAZ61705.1 phospholipid/glycerol acyltransferase [Calothrix sp. NIES-4105]
MTEFHANKDKSDYNKSLSAANPIAETSISRVSPWLTPLAYLLGRHLLLPLFFGHISVTGQQYIPKDGPVILAPTHRSRWDALLVPYAAGRCLTGRDLRFMVTITECQGLQGWFIRHLGGFPVNPKNPSITALRHAVDLLASGETLVIFPEGGIRKGKLHPLKPGIARLALSAESNHPALGVKIIPISIDYSQTNPTWGTNVNINIGKPIKVADYQGLSCKIGAPMLTADLASSLQQLSHHQTEITNHTFAEMTNS